MKYWQANIYSIILIRFQYSIKNALDYNDNDATNDRIIQQKTQEWKFLNSDATYTGSHTTHYNYKKISILS